MHQNAESSYVLISNNAYLREQGSTTMKRMGKFTSLKRILAAICILSSWGMNAQIVEDTVNVTPGSLATILDIQKDLITDLTLTGSMNATDVGTLRSMAKLTSANLAEVNIVEGGSFFISASGIGNCFSKNNALPDNFFYNMANIKSVVIPKSVTSIGQQAFYFCTGLTSVIIPNGVDSIRENAFAFCYSLPAVTIPESIKWIGPDAFRLCNSLNSLVIPDNAPTEIGGRAFGECARLKSVVIGNGATSIGTQVFMDCPELTSVTIGNNVPSIEVYAFKGCIKLDTVSIGSGVKFIGIRAFEGCVNLSSITIPDNVLAFHPGAFNGCTGLTTVSIGSGLNDFGLSTFLGCTALTGFSVSEENTAYNSLNGVLYNKEQNTLIAYPNAKGATYQIPNGVTTINEYAFDGCTGIVSLNASSSSLTSVGRSAFNNCTKLTSLTIGTGVTSIGSFAFSGCIALKEVTIPDKVVSMGEQAFKGCAALNKVIIGKSLSSVDNWLFDGCGALLDIQLKSAIPPAVYEYSFPLVDKQVCKLYVPRGSLAAYQAATIWKDFTNILEKDIADANTLVLDHFDQATTGEAVGTINYTDGLEGLGKAVDFSAGSSYIIYPVNKYMVNAGTVEMWVNLKELNKGLLTINLSKRYTAPSGGYVFHLGIDAAGKVNLSGWSTIVNNAFQSNKTLKLNTWTHIAVSWGDSTKIYINGIPDVVSPLPFRPAVDGGYAYVPYWGNSFGYMDDLHISNVKRTDAEIASRVEGFTGLNTSVMPQNVDGVTVFVHAGAIVVNDAVPGSTVAIYSPSGMLMSKITANSKSIIIKMATKQLYLVKIGSRTFKVVL